MWLDDSIQDSSFVSSEIDYKSAYMAGKNENHIENCYKSIGHKQNLITNELIAA